MLVRRLRPFYKLLLIKDTKESTPPSSPENESNIKESVFKSPEDGPERHPVE